MLAIAKIQRVASAAGRVLPVKEVQTLVAKFPARMVVDDIQDDGQAMHMAKIDERLELIHFAAEVGWVVAGQSLQVEKLVNLGDVRPQVCVVSGEVHLG